MLILDRKKETDVTDYFNEARANFITGEESINNFDKFVTEINRRGAEQLREVYQQIYTRYLEMKDSLKN